MTERSDSPDYDVSLNESSSVSSNTYQSITDMEREMSSFAFKEFEQGNYELCLKSLNYLETSRPQDSKVLHNVCIAEHYRTKCRNTSQLYNSLLDVCKQAHIDVLDIDSIDDVDQCVVFYNRAVVLYHLHQYQSSIDILDKVFQFVEPLDEGLSKKICFLLLELYLCTYQPKKALGLIGYIETILFGGSNGGSNSNSNNNGKGFTDKEETKDFVVPDKEKMQLIQCKARCYTMMRTAKSCKREVKSLLSLGNKADQIAAFFLKAQLEYQRGNYRKSIKILSAPEWPSQLSKNLCETGDCLQAIQYNNLGCIYNSMGKPGLGAHYTELGYKVLESEIENSKDDDSPDEFPSGPPIYTLNLNVRRALIYNMGMQHFRREKYLEAFRCLIEAAHTYCRNPVLWLRIAECCISINKVHPIGTKENPVVRAVVGRGKCKKIRLNPFNRCTFTKDTKNNTGIQPTLEYALRSLRNALLLLPKANSSSELSEKDVLVTSTSSADDKELNLTQEVCVVAALPCKFLAVENVQNLRNSIFIGLSYVSLRLGNTVPALQYAKNLLSQPKFSDAHKFLAHMYAGQALSQMDKISEAVEHFKPKLFSDISLAFPFSAEDGLSSNSTRAGSLPPENSGSEEVLCNKQKWHPNTIAAVKLIAQYNLAVAHTLREEWTKANHLVNQILTSSEAPPEAMALMIYIHLCQGSADKAREFINHCLPSHMKSILPGTKTNVNEPFDKIKT